MGTCCAWGDGRSILEETVVGVLCAEFFHRALEQTLITINNYISGIFYEVLLKASDRGV